MRPRPTTPPLLALAVSAALAGCAPRFDPRLVDAPIAGCAPRFDPRLVDAPIAGRRWVSTEDASHPLVGKIWDVRAARFVDEAALTAAVGQADFVFLGETHDNPDHHLLQARLVRAVGDAARASGRRPVLAFEMINADRQAPLDAALAAAPGDPEVIPSVAEWRGWPDFAWYRPIFQAGLSRGMRIVAANLPRAEMREIVKKGKEGLDPALAARLAREEPLPPEDLARLRAEMEESHCGELPEKMLDPMVLAQRARDARMAERLLATGGAGGGVLVTGKGHARGDRGVPALLAKDAPGRRIVAVGFFEADPDDAAPEAYGAAYGKGPLPFDYAVFTPGARRDDPCEGMKAHMEKKRAAEKAPRGGGKSP